MAASWAAGVFCSELGAKVRKALFGAMLGGGKECRLSEIFEGGGCAFGA